VVEQANEFLETSFLPGRVFSSPEDFNTQLDQWLPKANAPLVMRTGGRPADPLAADKAAMLALPPVPPVTGFTGFTAKVRLPRDCYVRMGSNDYSVHPQAVGQIEYHSRAMKAPRIREAATRLADQARDVGRTHEEYLTDADLAFVARISPHWLRRQPNVDATKPTRSGLNSGQ